MARDAKGRAKQNEQEIAAWERKMDDYSERFPDRIAKLLHAVVAHDMVKHATEDHDKVEASDARRQAYRAIAKRRAGKGQSSSHVGRRFFIRQGILTQTIRAGPIRVSGNQFFVLFQALAEYASFVEFGTSVNAAYPFMQPAAEFHKDTLRKRLKRGLKRLARETGVE